ncbi:carbohydrate ABC transporter permease [Paenibacillus hexagrammi]|uniref:Sugar ABC transporter permease n=1 Tax=Paenibacillus hexagrammi TaxID=2908839 RepID=A0ABY3SDR4_9BACL|nr:sugar ABC transporter permease [Paenibacillus sp. YPD9-1]UJF32134.1 sugar ABC transporter permease [Paenibacillus sp. YPD9-1]
MRLSERFYSNVFILPALIYLLIMVGYPMFENLRLSLYNVDVMNIAGTPSFIGLSNYRALLHDDIFWKSTYNTLIYTVLCIVLQFIIGFVLALLFSQKFSLAERLRGLVMISWLMPITVTGLMFKFMFSLNGGILNEILMSLHLVHQPVEWLVNPSNSMWAVIIANTWIGVPFNMILITTGLTTIPKDVYESASIDGANAMDKFFRITLPLLKPAITSLLVLGFIYTFKVFDLIVIMTNGGPVNATEMMSTFSYKLSFVEYKFSEGATVANVLFIILFLVSLGYLKLVSKEEVM